MDIVSGDNLPPINVIIPLPMEKRCLEGERNVQIARNFFVSTKMGRYFLDPILHHNYSDLLCKKSLQGSQK